MIRESVRMPLSSHGWITNTTHFSVIIRIIPPGVTVSDANHESTPYIEYRLSANDPTQHQDVMVASTFDCTALNTGQVRMQFSHILFCINIAVNNYRDEAIRLDNVICRFTSPLYSTYRIKMDKSEPDTGGTITNASYLMASSVNVSNTSATGAINITDADRFLMLIPQRGLQGTILSMSLRADKRLRKWLNSTTPTRSIAQDIGIHSRSIS